jgi:hypothetical protein
MAGAQSAVQRGKFPVIVNVSITKPIIFLPADIVLVGVLQEDMMNGIKLSDLKNHLQYTRDCTIHVHGYAR